MAGIWRDFLTALVEAVRRRDTQPSADERRRAVEKLADQRIREDQRKRPPEH
ncbi:hypothetical protein ACQPYA_30650 [Micromonospora sp. CA-263727]|uniref:hypothetical protein n=1 Tax=Micromonospora sp. CA-263727 TaxID=3239967 RepID=UPI003D8E929C